MNTFIRHNSRKTDRQTERNSEKENNVLWNETLKHPSGNFLFPKVRRHRFIIKREPLGITAPRNVESKFAYDITTFLCSECLQ